MTERLASLDAIEAEVWQQLEAATRDRQHAWRTPVLATVNGGAADARSVILREVDAAQKQLLTYTDHRAGKVAQLLSHPVGTLVMWSPALGWQLRCRVQLSVETTGLAVTSRWAAIKVTAAAQDYLARLPPGAALEAPDTAPAEPMQREHFAVVTAQVLALDWLELSREGHRRAVFDDRGARWVQP